MSEMIPEMSNKESDRLIRLSQNRQTSIRESVMKNQEQFRVSESTVKSRRIANKFNKANLNENKKNSAINLIADAPFVPAFLAAILKDFLDLIIFAMQAVMGASLFLAPLIGVAIALGTIITWCVSIFIAMMLILAGQGGKRKHFKKIAVTFIKRAIVWLGFSLIESFPGTGIFPLETFMVGLIFLMVINERKKIIKLKIVDVSMSE